jgi:hypothetical protein
LKNKASKDTFVHEIMDKEILVKPTDDLDYCMDLITNVSPVLFGGESSWNYFYW